MLESEIAHRENPTFGIVKPPKPDGFGGNSGIPTVRGYNAPCFEGMVHYYIGSVLMLLDNEDEKDKVSIVLAIQNEPKARYYYTSSGCF